MSDYKPSEIQDNILTESKNLMVKVSANALLEGEIEIVSKNGLGSLAEIDEEIYNYELIPIFDKIARFYKESYNKDLVWYEHTNLAAKNRKFEIICLPVKAMLIKTAIKDLGMPCEFERFERMIQKMKEYKKYYVINQYDTLLIFRAEKATKNYIKNMIARILKIENIKQVNRNKKLEENWGRW